MPPAVKGTSEPGIPGIGVDLYTGSGDHFSTTTDADGHYNFSGVDPGICDYVVLGPHPGWSSTTASGAGIYFSGDSDAEGPDFGLSTSTTAGGVVSFDRDGTGTFSPGDGGAGNVTLFGDTNHNGILDPGEPVAVSNPDGSFQIGNLLSSGGGSDVAIRAIGPAGWQPTTPGGDLVTIPVGSDTPNLNFSFSPAALGAVGGTAFYDLNQNGVLEEEGVSGLTVMLVTPAGNSLTTTTDAGGGYYFGGLTPRTYSISITIPDGWGLTTSNPLSATVTASTSVVSGLDFGVYQLPPPPPPPTSASVSGTIFRDQNANGSRDGAEPGVDMSSVTLTVLSGPDAGQSFFVNTSAGDYTFDMLSVGDSVQVTSSGVWGCRPTLGSDSAFVYDLSADNPNVTGIDIGWTGGIIQGGAYDVAALLPVSGLTITLTGPDGVQTSTSDGFAFLDLNPYADYTLSVAPGNGYRSATMNVRPSDFADFIANVQLQVVHATGAVSGKVFEDIDGDGTQGMGEQGQGGWDVYADENGDGAQNNQEPGTTTAADGTYQLSGIAPTPEMKIRAVPVAGWREPAAQTPTLIEGSSETGGVDFAARKMPTLSIELVQDGSEDPDPEHPDDGPKPVIFEVTRTGYYGETLESAAYPCAFEGTADQIDFSNSLPATINFAEGDIYKRLIFVPKDDPLVESTKTFTLGIQPYTTVPESAESILKRTAHLLDNDFSVKGESFQFGTQGITADTGVSYSQTQWVDLDLDGVADQISADDGGVPTSSSQSGFGAPISVVRSTSTAVSKVSVDVDFVMNSGEAGSLPSGTYRLLGYEIGKDVTSMIAYFSGALNVSGSELTGHLISDKPLPNTILSTDLNLRWAITRSLSGQPAPPPSSLDLQNFAAGGDSKNHLYVTGVPAADERETVIDIGCRNASGVAPDGAGIATVANRIWSDFADASVANVAGTIMKYDHTPPFGLNRNFLIENSRGPCGAWGYLLRDVFQAQGVRARAWGILPRDPIPATPEVAFIEKDILVIRAPAQGDGPGLYQPFGKPPVQYGGFSCTKLLDHCVVTADVFGEMIFDPSYAVTSASPVAWEQSHLAGFSYDRGGIQTDHIEARKDNAEGTTDAVWVPQR